MRKQNWIQNEKQRTVFSGVYPKTTIHLVCETLDLPSLVQRQIFVFQIMQSMYWSGSKGSKRVGSERERADPNIITVEINIRHLRLGQGQA